MTFEVHQLDRLDPAVQAAVRELVASDPHSVDNPPISERGLLHLPAGPPFQHFVAHDGGELVGYLQCEETPDEVSLELVAADTALADDLVAHAVALESGSGRRLMLWAHGATSLVHHAARHNGFEAVRSLFQMRRPLAEPKLADQEPPPGITIRTFVPGQDDADWLRVNARAFAWHPEQAAWTQEDLAGRLASDWFDPAGFFLAIRDGEIVGFHWTKIHNEVLGEVYVIGIDPDAQGLSLGGVLLNRGLQYLADKGLWTVALYTEATNVRAMRLYGKFGFTEFSTDTRYARN